MAKGLETRLGLEKLINFIVSEYKPERIILFGSYGTEMRDENSDIDLYIYKNEEIPIAVRKEITEEFSDDMEINNQYWETEDDGHIRGLTLGIDIIYRDYNWVKRELERVLDNYVASVGYTTCIWYNFATSKILYDEKGWFKKLQNKYNIKYPSKLKYNIINKNYPLLRKLIHAIF